MMWTAQAGQDRNREGRPSSQVWLAKTTGMSIPQVVQPESLDQASLVK